MLGFTCRYAINDALASPIKKPSKSQEYSPPSFQAAWSTSRPSFPPLIPAFGRTLPPDLGLETSKASRHALDDIIEGRISASSAILIDWRIVMYPGEEDEDRDEDEVEE